jgi:hypothetical protein
VNHETLPSNPAPPGNAPESHADEQPAPGGRARSARTKLAQKEKLKVWVRAGGTCVLCKRYLLEGALTGLEVSLGELAHIVGQQNSPRSPRGEHPMSRKRRDTADNVILACESCHQEIDDQLATGILDVAALAALKADHESRVRHVVTLPDDRRSLVLRAIGQLRGNAVEISRATAAETVVAERRFPWFDLDRDRLGVEIDLRALPGEAIADDMYYLAACRAIDEVIDNKVHDAIKSGDVRHVSVFPFARLPLLVYLGTKLEDNYSVEVYQRHRATQTWTWDPTAPTTTFTTAYPSAFVAVEAVLVLNVSGTVSTFELPDELASLPRITVKADMVPSPDAMRSRASLEAFCTVIRDVNAHLDAHKGLTRLHVFGALPPTAAVELGRLHDSHIHPALVLYDRLAEGGYRRALEI